MEAAGLANGPGTDDLDGVNHSDAFLETQTQTCDTDFVSTQGSEHVHGHAVADDTSFFWRCSGC